MTDPTGRHVWFELATTDLDAAARFYGEVLGWSVRPSDMPGMDYRMAGPPDHSVAGLMLMDEAMKAQGLPCAWGGYVAVTDVDAASAQVQSLGGAVLVPGQDIPGVGRFAVAADPQGAVFSLFSGTPGEDAPPPAPPGTPGHFGWHELHTTDLEAAWSFYSALFGWTLGERLDMGAAGVYQLFATGSGPDATDGGMALKQPETPQPFWLYYVNVASVDAVIARTMTQGGQVLMGPHEVPGGGFIAVACDPQGAQFAVVGPR